MLSLSQVRGKVHHKELHSDDGIAVTGSAVVSNVLGDRVVHQD